MIVDSGTSFFLMPKNDRSQLFNFLRNETDVYCYESSIMVCYCDDRQYNNSFPDFTFSIDGVKYFLPKESYVIREGNLCQLGIMTHDTMELWILGLNFFSNYYTIFD